MMMPNSRSIPKSEQICYRMSNWEYIGQTQSYSRSTSGFAYYGNKKRNEDGMKKAYQNEIADMLSAEGDMITGDNTCFPKKGRNLGLKIPMKR